MAWLRATYLIRSAAADIAARSDALAVEQSVEMPLDAVRDERVRRDVVARVVGIEAVGAERFRVQLDLALSTIGGDLTQLLNMAFGNCSLQDDVELVDLDLPSELLAEFPALRGPRHGVDGLRRLVGATDGRAMTATALKPQGRPPAALAELAGSFARAGIDLVKDDHGLADQAAAPFARRVAACQRAVSEANRHRGGSTRYAPSLVGGPRQVARHARLARDEGVEVVLVAPMLVGLGAFAELVEDGLDSLAVLAHPAFGGAQRMAAPLLMGKLFRLAGADAVIFTNHGGRFAVDEADCAALADNARRSWGDARPALPVPAGGMTPGRAAELVRFYGTDVALLVGGALLQAGEGGELEAAAGRFVAATRAASEGASPNGPAPEGASPNRPAPEGAGDRASSVTAGRP